MTGPEFVNVKINVNGKQQTIKMEKGVQVRTSKHLFGTSNVFDIQDYDRGVYKPSEQINMSEDEFKLLKNIADNVKEGKELTLSSADIDDAMTKFENYEFTKDIKKGFPKEYKFNPKSQDMDWKQVYAHIEEPNAHLCVSKPKEDKYDEYVLDFDVMLKISKMSRDGSVIANIHESGDFYGYIDEKNRTVDVFSDGTPWKISKNYTDKDGNTIREEYNPKTKQLVYRQINERSGKQVFEEYGENGVVKKRSVEYENDDGSSIREKYDEN